MTLTNLEKLLKTITQMYQHDTSNVCCDTQIKITLKYITAALGTAKYSYDFKVDDKGVEHYEVGPETLSCQAVNEPEITISSELRQALEDGNELMTINLGSLFHENVVGEI